MPEPVVPAPVVPAPVVPVPEPVVPEPLVPEPLVPKPVLPEPMPEPLAPMLPDPEPEAAEPLLPEPAPCATKTGAGRFDVFRFKCDASPVPMGAEPSANVMSNELTMGTSSWSCLPANLLSRFHAAIPRR